MATSKVKVQHVSVRIKEYEEENNDKQEKEAAPIRMGVLPEVKEVVPSVKEGARDSSAPVSGNEDEESQEGTSRQTDFNINKVRL